eukprot:gene10745-22446_t
MLFLVKRCQAMDGFETKPDENPVTIELNERLDRLERIFNSTYIRKTHEDLSHIELMWDSLKRVVISSIPATDELCKFNYTTGYCYPRNQCRLQFKMGDYTLSRACRLVNIDYINIVDDDNDPWVVRLGGVVLRQMEKGLNLLRKHAPPTDDECSWDFRRSTCIPFNQCYFDYQLGDFSPHRSCRAIRDIIDEKGNH